MAKTKRISINSFEKVMNESENIINFDWHGTEITVKKVISLKEMLALVNYVVDTCFDNKGEYHPEVRTFAFNVAILERYANFTIPKNAENAYDLVYRTDAVNCVLSNIDDWQIEDIVTAIDQKIEYKLSINADALYSQISELYNTLAGVIANMEETFTGVDITNFEKLATAISDGQIDEKKIADAWMSNFRMESGE